MKSIFRRHYCSGLIVAISTLFFVGCSEQVASPPEPEPSLVSIEISPLATTLLPGATETFEVIGLFSDGTKEPFEEELSWSSDDEDIATIDADGTAEALRPGQARIRAAHEEFEAQAVLTVSSAQLDSLSIDGPDEAPPAGIDIEIGAFASLSDGSELDVTNSVEWQIADTDIVEERAPGRLQALSPGTTQIEATLAGLTASLSLTVSDAEITSIEVVAIDDPANGLLFINGSRQLQALATLSDDRTIDISHAVTWSTLDTSVATIDADLGILRGEAEGQTQAQATFASNENTISGDLTIVVVPSPHDFALPAGNHSFNTDTGELTVDGESAEVVPAWNDLDGRLVVRSFSLADDAVLDITGDAPFRLVSYGDIVIDGQIDGRGEDGADGEDGPANPGEDGAHGRSLYLIGFADLSFSGAIDLSGGHGGDGGDNADSVVPVDLGRGGHGGDAGSLSISVQGSRDESGEVTRNGGNGGDGGSSSVANNLLTTGSAVLRTTGDGGNGGFGKFGGHGGHGGDLSVGGTVFTPNDVATGRGGHGGDATDTAGDGGNGGAITIGENINIGDTSVRAGDGGNGGFGPTLGGHGGDGGSVTVDGNAGEPFFAGDGGDGGDSDTLGGDGGAAGICTSGTGQAGTDGDDGLAGSPGAD